MFAFTFEVTFVLFVAFLLGCISGCLLARRTEKLTAQDEPAQAAGAVSRAKKSKTKKRKN